MKKLFAVLFLLAFLSACAQKQEVIPMNKLDVSSTAFAAGAPIPEKYTCDGENISPPLSIGGIPDGTKTLVIIADDPDSPSGTFTHWVVWNLAPSELIEEKFSEGTSGINDFGKNSYSGPCPHSGTHRYFFRVYALDSETDIGADSTASDVRKAMKNHILAEGEIMGTYSRS